ncbi:MAG: hypothetical protein PUI85_03050 [Eubacteriales bacterium]|nr:hypothetical protein [Eubacteriales bacterium]MDY3333177.1 hypothetical protein [Gallibacter sp.]
MLKYFKFEFKSTFKPFLIIFIAMNVVLLTLQTLLLRPVWSYGMSGGFFNTVLIFSLILSVTVTGIMFIAYVVNIYKNELYRDSGYMTFLLPLKGRSILTAKLLVAFIWSSLMVIVCGFLNLGYMSILGMSINYNPDVLIYGFTNAFGFILALIIEAAIMGFTLISLMYLAITIARMLSKSRASVLIAVVVFVVSVAIYLTVLVYLWDASRSVFVFSDFAFSSLREMLNERSLEALKFFVSIPMVFTALANVGIVYFTGYLLDKSVNL